MSLYSRLDRIAADVEKLNRQVNSVANSPQAQRTSIEAGTMDINDEDGNLISSVGFQEDGSGAVRFFDGPVPPVPSGVTASADGPIIQATWDGSFVDGQEATYDLAYLEVAATLVDDDSRVSFATITAKEGASASVVANQSGLWAVAVRSVSQAGKKSEFASAGTVEVKLVDLAGAIEAVQDSANGKNKVTYSSHAPTEADPGIFDDTWFVGQVGRPNDVVEATNYVLNPSAHTDGSSWRGLTYGGATATDTFQTHLGKTVYRSTLTSSSGYVYLEPAIGYSGDLDTLVPVTPGEVISGAMLLARSYSGNANLRFGFRSSSGSHVAWSSDGPVATVNSSGFTRLVIENKTVPANAAYAFVHVSTTSGSGEWVEGAGAIISKTATVPDFFDGDTPSGATPNESHYRWTGTPHASTSEKYLPALDIGESSNWNIIEQYRHDGNGWVKVELSHYVFSTVDLGKATVGELDGIRIMARTITGDLFSGDAFDGLVFRGNTFVTRDGNGEFSDRGLFFQKPDGTAIFRVPTDGTAISMSASDVQIERAQVDELELNVGRVRSGGLFELSSGVTPPASPPELNSAWQRHATLPTPAERSDYSNLAYWGNGNSWVRAINVLGTGEGDRIEIYDYDTGELTGSFPIKIDPRHGVTIMGDTVYIMGKDHDVTEANVFIFGYDLNTGARTSRHEYTSGIQAKNALGNDGTNLIIGSVYNRKLWVHYRSPTTGLQVGADMLSGENTWPPADASDLFGISVNSAGTEFTVVPTVAARVYSVSGGTLTHKPDPANVDGLAGWVNPDRQAAGCAWVNGIPYPVDSQGNVYAGSTSASDYAAELCYTWYDGTHETTPSPVATVDVSARERITISFPARAGLQKRLYARSSGGSGSWARSTVPADVTVSTVPVGLALFTPPSSNSFPNADPAIFRSSNGNVVVRGDGSGHWGPLTFNADGTVTGIPKVAAGRDVELIAPASGGIVDKAITFPPGRFTTPPAVTIGSHSTASTLYNIGVSGVTKDGFILSVNRANNTPTLVDWIATEII